jgi:tRNA(Ile)-lysidine synthase
VNFEPAVVAGRLAALAPAFPSVELAVAVSGGADSAALTHALAALAGDQPRLRLRALHVDHGLQDAADELRAAAVAVAARCAVPLQILAVRVESIESNGVEAAARHARYAALAAELRDGEFLLTAHHREDQAETLLLQLLRGAGLKGAAAMPASAPLGRGRLLRPLLDVARADLLAYAAHHRLPWTDDPMNADPRYDRAYLRQAVWPRLVARWPAAARTLSRAAGHAADAQALLDDHAQEDVERLSRGDALDVAGLLALAQARRSAVLRRWLSSRGVRSPPAHRLALVERELLRARSTTGPRLAWDGIELRRFGAELHLVPALDELPRQAALSADAPVSLGTLGRLVLRRTSGVGLSAQRVATPLAVRPRSGGERLRLAVDGPRRALKDCLRESGVPPWVRERLPVLWDGERLVAVALPDGAWIDASAVATADEPSYAIDWLDAPPGFTRR